MRSKITVVRSPRVTVEAGLRFTKFRPYGTWMYLSVKIFLNSEGVALL